MTLQAVVLEKTPNWPHMIGEPYPVPETTVEEYAQSWRNAGSPSVKITGKWETWHVVRIQCHPKSRDPIAWRGVRDLDALPSPLPLSKERETIIIDDDPDDREEEPNPASDA